MWRWIIGILLLKLIGVEAFAGGGFGNSKAKVKANKKRKNRKKGGLASEEFIKSSKETKKAQEPKLDRFGLPIITAENLFPELPSEIEIEFVSQDEETDLETIKKSVSDYLKLDFNLFDENGIEKTFSDDQLPWKLRLLHKSPPVLAVENFFSESECETYTQFTKAPEKKSEDDEDSPLKINSATFSTLAQSKRTSTTWYCHYRQVPILLAKTKRLLNNLPLEQMEEAQIVRYRIGEEFSWHYDEIPREQLRNGGQRIATLLVYLNTLSDTGGGGTIFRDLKGMNGIGELKMRPKKGSALLFFPAKIDGTPDDRTLHKGEVAAEEKMISQIWIHKEKYHPIIPDGNSHEAAIDAVKDMEVKLGYRR